MTAISSSHPQDNNYSKFTPSGNFDIYITNEDLHGHFKPGKVYGFTIQEIPADVLSP